MECYFYKKDDDKLRCSLCPHNCLIKKEHTGVCGVRKAVLSDNELKLVSLNYGEVTSISLDPIEKKPLINFYPNSQILSIGSFGCNFKCSFCQNYSISQYKSESKHIDIIEMTDFVLNMDNNLGLAFTYNEPTIWYEYVFQLAKNIKEKDSSKKIVLVTNGFINEAPFLKLLPFIDALNIDLKGNANYYQNICFGLLEPVKNTIRLAYEYKKHIELTLLLVPNQNTDKQTLKDIGEFIQNIDRTIPLHLSRYFPRYKMIEEPTSLELIKSSYNFLKDYLDNIILGNLTDHEKEYIYTD
ncbi:radical SAM protein [uncultured Clostridium sp.]|uniref:radical SAM protein n=1 Tax=uncultured Clostridium sp. TaxID=59620 RepID=UPI00262829B6|nr:radical SAM protein [uncultured Clostridium sp.]